MGVFERARQKTVAISLIHSTSKLGLGPWGAFWLSEGGAWRMCGTFFDQAESWCTPCDSANIDSLKLGSMHTLISLRSRGVYVGHTTANQAWVTLKVSWVMFSDLVRSDLPYSKAYFQSLGICQSPASSVCIESFREMPPGRENRSTMAPGVE